MSGESLRHVFAFLVIAILVVSIPVHSEPIDGFIDEDVNLDDILADLPALDIEHIDGADLAGLPFFDPVSADMVIVLRDSLGFGDAFWAALDGSGHLTPIQREILLVASQQGRREFHVPFTGRIRSGFIHRPAPESPADGKYYLSLNTSVGSAVKTGVVAERDPFEPHALDLLSWYGSYSFDRGRSRIILGDFRPGFGQNLVFSRYARTYVDGISVMSGEPRRVVNTQFEETAYLRGVHVTSRRGPITVQAWGSIRALDAAVDGGGNAVTIRDSGLHLSGSERGNLDERLFAGRVSCRPREGLSMGVALAAAEYTPSLARKDGEQYMNDPEGSDFTTVSLDAVYRRDAVTMFFEHARNPDGGRATAGGIQVREHGIGASLQGHEYTPDYWAPRPAGLSSFGSTENEKGVYGAVQADLPGGVRAVVSLDHARLLSRNFSHAMPISRRRAGCVVSAVLRDAVALKFVARNVDDSDSPEDRWNSRFHIGTPARSGRIWSTECIAAWSESGNSGGPYAEWKSRLMLYGFSGLLSAAVFDIPSYESRFYRYEHDVPGRGMSRPVWGEGGSVVCVFRRGAFSFRYRHVNSNMMGTQTELTLQSDMVF